MNAAAGHRDPALRVLVVEDYPDTAASLAAILALDAHEVDTARDGLAAVAACTQRWPDVLLLDLVLPGYGGYEVAKRICEEAGARPRLLLVVVRGYAAPSDVARSRAAGIDLHFIKPVDLDLLLSLLRRFATVRHGGSC
jgi:CheY-like chemotaxis protein